MKLKPCPFCGGEDIRCEYEDTIAIYCYECDCQSMKCETIEEAIEAWNRREPIDKIVEQLEAEIESSDKYIAEYDDSEVQKVWNAGMRKCLEIVKGGAV